LNGTSGSINVVTNAAPHLSVTGPASSFARQPITVTVTALDAANNTSSAEIFDPSTGTVTATGSLSVPRESHTATLLNNGTVLLVAGGSDSAVGNPTPAATTYATAELFNPSTGHFTAAGMMTTQRDFFTASLLGNGKVLAAGGLSNAASFLETADLFDPTSASFAATGI
jgi:hypothetical protein